MTRPPAETLPSFLIIGAEKAGTTWLHSVLARHPDVFLPDVKELHFFNSRDSNLRRLANFERRGLGWYAAQFTAGTSRQARGEATPLYLSDQDAPARIAAALPGIRLVALLRDPVERSWSHYRMARAKGHLHDPFATLIDRDDPRIIGRSLYAGQLEIYRRLFPADALHVAYFEDVTGPNGRAAIARICTFLGIDPARLPTDAIRASARNTTTTYRSAWAYNASVRGARMLRATRVTAGLARGLKTGGVYDALKRLNQGAPSAEPLDPALAARLAPMRHDVARALSTMFPDTPPPWHLPTLEAAC
jgi:hypothetical protein